MARGRAWTFIAEVRYFDGEHGIGELESDPRCGFCVLVAGFDVMKNLNCSACFSSERAKNGSVSACLARES